MSTAALDHVFPGPWPYEGTITSRDDPYGLGRVRATIPGEVDETEWLWPIGQLKAGAKGRGALTVPPLGADIVIFYIGGQRENGRYLAGNFGRDELPAGTSVASDAEARTGEGDNTVWNDGRVKVEVDSRAASAGVRISDAVTGLGIDIDFNATTRTATITGQLGVVVSSSGTISISGSTVLINGRPVSPVGPPI
jgi:hypothetical protein